MSVDWDRWYREVYPELVRFLHRMVWDADRAEDLAPETFLRAIDRDPDDPRGWLFTVALNLARDEARTAQRRKRHLVLIRSEVRSEHESRSDQQEEIERSERVEAVRQALETLTRRDREALLLKEAGFSYTEIADQTGLAVGAVGTTLARARRKLAEAYGDQEGNRVARG